jgi:hypothetical protein
MFAYIIVLLTTVSSVSPTVDPTFEIEIQNIVRLFAVSLGLLENRVSSDPDQISTPLRAARVEEFLSHCVSDAVIRHPRTRAVGIETADRRYLVGNVAIAEVGENQLPQNVLLSVPPEIHDSFVGYLMRFGVSGSFQNCTADAIEALPFLTIVFEAGNIILEGSDLFENRPSDNSCFPRYAVSDYLFHIVPELFPGMNVLFDYNQIYICDAL